MTYYTIYNKTDNKAVVNILDENKAKKFCNLFSYYYYYVKKTV